jgi:hypothetical protein
MTINEVRAPLRKVLDLVRKLENFDSPAAADRAPGKSIAPTIGTVECTRVATPHNLPAQQDAI